MAHHVGAKEKVLHGKRIYHIEHDSGWTPETESVLNVKMRAAQIPMLSFETYRSMASAINRSNRLIRINGEQWGLTKEPLKILEIR